MWHILVVDNETECLGLSGLLERAGFESEQASSCQEALDSARQSRPQLVLLDVSLPDGSGFEICRELRDLYGEALPIIFYRASARSLSTAPPAYSWGETTTSSSRSTRTSCWRAFAAASFERAPRTRLRSTRAV